MWQERYMNAIQHAVAAHNGQTRFNSAEPYVMHPIRVSRKIYDLTGSLMLATGGVCHDLLEDTKTTEADITEFAGADVAGLVKSVTKNMSLPKAEREDEFLERYHYAGVDTVIIKLADRSDNLTDLNVQSESFKLKYKANTWQLLMSTPIEAVNNQIAHFLINEVIVKAGLLDDKSLKWLER
jgi:GTP pyrophosphokinase